MVALKITPDKVAIAMDINIEDIPEIIDSKEYEVEHIPATEAFEAFLIYHGKGKHFNEIASQLYGKSRLFGSVVILMTDGNKPIDCTKDFRDGMTRKMLILQDASFVDLSHIKRKR